MDRQLDLEAGDAAASAGRWPLRPVCLSEVEAVGLLLLAVEAQLRPDDGPIGPAVAHRLAQRLRHRLDDLSI